MDIADMGEVEDIERGRPVQPRAERGRQRVRPALIKPLGTQKPTTLEAIAAGRVHVLGKKKL